MKFGIQLLDTLDDGGGCCGIRPEHISARPHSERYAEFDLAPVLIELTGYDKNVTFDFFGNEIVGRLPRNAEVGQGQPAHLYFDLGEISLFDAETGRRI